MSNNIQDFKVFRTIKRPPVNQPNQIENKTIIDQNTQPGQSVLNSITSMAGILDAIHKYEHLIGLTNGLTVKHNIQNKDKAIYLKDNFTNKPVLEENNHSIKYKKDINTKSPNTNTKYLNSYPGIVAVESQLIIIDNNNIKYSTKS